jgi:Cell division protein FtsQ
VSRRLTWSLAVVLTAIAAGALYQLFVADKAVSGKVRVPLPAATIGSGEEAVAVSANGAIVPWFPLPAEPELPRLPLAEPPRGGRLAGPMLQQARVLGAAPAALRPHLAASHYGDSGVDVETTSGVELRFGDASQLVRKWRAAVAVLADLEVTALDYVDLHAPGRPALGGSGHTLPPAP